MGGLVIHTKAKRLTTSMGRGVRNQYHHMILKQVKDGSVDLRNRHSFQSENQQSTGQRFSKELLSLLRRKDIHHRWSSTLQRSHCFLERQGRWGGMVKRMFI
jgi:hypothetical protein